ncbi:MAG: MerR family transcriptional regulator [Clostridiales bacterium]|nr:MerR family transcriptional regulator [Clostridiales bacterium]
MNQINKRTLHYYDEIGLFCPEYKTENGYRYYTCFQIVQLELILTLRKIGMSVDEIKKYMECPSGAFLSQMIADQNDRIEKAIRQLTEAGDFLKKKSERLQQGMEAYHGKTELIRLPERKILLSDPIKGAYDDEDFSVAAQFSMRLKKIFGLYDNFGSRISSEKIMQKKWNEYDCFFAYGDENAGEYDVVIPEGMFLRAYCVGSWERIREIYQQILEYAERNQLVLADYAYEEGLNEMSVQRSEDYITMITVPVSSLN